MSIYKQDGVKSECISLWCTKNEKEKLLKRIDALKMDITDYLHSILFPQGPLIRNSIEFLIEIQDLVVHIKEIYKEDNIQEEDGIWRKIRELL